MGDLPFAYPSLLKSDMRHKAIFFIYYEQIYYYNLSFPLENSLWAGTYDHHTMYDRVRRRSSITIIQHVT